MALTNPQYDSIMRMYNRRQLQHRHELEERRKTAYAKIPRLPEIDRDIASISVQKARDMLNGGPHAGLDLRAAIAELAQERTALLVSNGFPADYLEPSYDCPLCRDTGYRRQKMRML